MYIEEYNLLNICLSKTYFTITNKATMNIVEHVPLWHDGILSGYIPKSGIVGSSGRTISNFLRNLQIDFQSGCPSFPSQQQWRNVPLSPNPCHHVLSPEVLILAILICARCYLRVILICISLITQDFSLITKHLKSASQTFEFPQL